MESQRNGREGGKVGDAPVEGAVGDRSRGVGGRATADPELVERPRRRTFKAAYKLTILQEADACEKPGEVGALLRREGLYSSHLASWRKQRDRGALQAMSRPRGRPKPDPRDAQIERLLRRSERAEAELATARKVIEVQGNVSALLEELLKAGGAKQSGSSGR